jgi:hypothetical protein
MRFRILKNRIVVVFIYLIGITNGCRSENYEENNIVEIDKLKYTDTLFYSDIFEDYYVIPLETNEDCLIGEIKSIRFSNDKIIILDSRVSKSIFVFDQKGNFIRKIGCLGKGPGEFIQPHSISVNKEKEELAIYDAMLNKIQLYSLSGEFIKSITLNRSTACASIEIFDNAIYLSNRLDGVSKYLLQAIDFDGKEVGKWLRNYYKKKSQNVYSPTTIFFQTANGLMYRSWFMNDIFKIDNNTIESTLSLKVKNDKSVIKRNNMSDIQLIEDLHEDKPIKIASYAGTNKISIIDYIYYSDYNMLFYNHANNSNKIVNIRNFKDDITNISCRKMGRFYTSHNNCLVMPLNSISGMYIRSFIENVKTGKIKSKDFNLSRITTDSNPPIILYKLKENTQI